jgi:uncharacterized protein with HEPN domain
MEYCHLTSPWITGIPNIRVVDTWETEGYDRDPDKEEFTVQVDTNDGWAVVTESQVVEEAIEIALTLKLALKFKSLINERDALIHGNGYDTRCYKIDDELIPDIIKEVIPAMRDRFNTFINQ